MADVVRGKPAALRGVVSYSRSEILTLPNALTGSRFGAGAAIPFLVGYPSVVFVLALWGVVSDFLDGVLARRLNQATEFGRVLDQFTDALFGAALIYAILRWEGFNLRNLSIVIGIGLFVLGVGWLRFLGKALHSSMLSKWRISMQFAAAVVIIGVHAHLPVPYPEELRTLAHAALWLSIPLMGLTLFWYAKYPNA